MTVRVRVEFIQLSAASSDGNVANVVATVHRAAVYDVGTTAWAGTDRLKPPANRRAAVGHVRITPLDGMVLASWGQDETNYAVSASTRPALLLMPGISEVIPITAREVLSLVEFV